MWSNYQHLKRHQSQIFMKKIEVGIIWVKHTHFVWLQASAMLVNNWINIFY